MAKNADYDLKTHKKERIAYGVLIAALGCLWMAVELGWLSTGMPIGPIIVIIIGFAFFLPWLKD